MTNKNAKVISHHLGSFLRSLARFSRWILVISLWHLVQSNTRFSYLLSLGLPFLW